MSSSASVQLWEDADGDGTLGSAGDVFVDGMKIDADGAWTLDPSDCDGCGLVIDWGGSNGEIDTLTGEIEGWGGSNGEIYGWGGSGDDIDWGGSVDDID